MLTRLDLPAIARLARRDLPAPVDVVNLIRAGDDRFESYRWYGLLVMPVLRLAGGRIRWAGRHEGSLYGESQGDKLLVVRYPSHRRFLAMTLNPYYFAINVLRERGIDAFEASFMHASRDRDLPGRRLMLAVHFHAGRSLETIAQAVGGELVYAAHQTAAIPFSVRGPTDPKPLTYGQVALFDVADPGDVDASPLGDVSVQLYRREPLRDLAPSLVRS